MEEGRWRDGGGRAAARRRRRGCGLVEELRRWFPPLRGLCSEGVSFGVSWGERQVIPAGEIAGGRASFPDVSGYICKTGVHSGVFPALFPAAQGIFLGSTNQLHDYLTPEKQ